jgi:CubicO group peptidase (beta-lactamase class C family)
MTADGVRAGAVAVARAGEVLLARGYTWAEDDYPVTEPGTTFRLASVSKAFTAAAVEQLVAQGLLAWDTPVFPRLGLTGAVLPGQTVDPDIDGVTVRQLLLRASGMRRDVGDLRAIAARLSTAVVPTRAQLVAFLHGEPLEFRPSPPDPPGEGHYSNAAFTVLTSLVEQVSGRPFVDHLRTALLHPEGIGDLAVAATRHGGAQPGEVASYDSPGVSASLLEPGTDRLAPDAHGGAFTLENGEGSGGLLASAPSVARFIARHAVWDVGPRQTAARYGEFEGTTAGAVSRGDGLDVAFLFNRRVGDAQHDGIRRAVDEWLDSVG